MPGFGEAFIAHGLIAKRVPRLDLRELDVRRRAGRIEDLLLHPAREGRVENDGKRSRREIPGRVDDRIVIEKPVAYNEELLQDAVCQLGVAVAGEIEDESIVGARRLGQPLQFVLDSSDRRVAIADGVNLLEAVFRLKELRDRVGVVHAAGEVVRRPAVVVDADDERLSCWHGVPLRWKPLVGRGALLRRSAAPRSVNFARLGAAFLLILASRRWRRAWLGFGGLLW
jgi:hypothetical protein